MDEAAKRYADQLFAKKMEECATQHRTKAQAIELVFARRNMVRSGMYWSARMDEYLAHTECLARGLMDSRVLAARDAGLAVDDDFVKEIVDGVNSICDARRCRLVDECNRQNASAPPSHERALQNGLELGLLRIRAQVIRDLSIVKDRELLRARSKSNEGPAAVKSSTSSWDVFICHASEDKDSFVRPLADALSEHLRVWYDDFSLDVGDSLRQSIDRGLASSRYGVVVLSKHFFAKKWPQKELNGLVAKETGQDKVILPVWHQIAHEEVLKFSPTLADTVAAKSAEGLDAVVGKLLRAMNRTEGPQNPKTVVPAHSLGARLSMVIEDYKRRGTPKHIIDTFDDLSVAEKADLYDQAVRSKKGKPSKRNPYRE